MALALAVWTVLISTNTKEVLKISDQRTMLVPPIVHSQARSLLLSPTAIWLSIFCSTIGVYDMLVRSGLAAFLSIYLFCRGRNFPLCVYYA